MKQCLSFLKKISSYIVFPLSIFFLDLVMTLSVHHTWTMKEGCSTFLFSAMLGCTLTVLVKSIRKPLPRKILNGFLLFLLALIFGMNYFVHCEFGLFYSPITVLSSASDAVSEFSGDIKALIFSVNGLWHSFLFLIPFLLYIVLLRRFDQNQDRWIRNTFLCLLCIPVFALGGYALVSSDETLLLGFTREYLFDTAVGRYGTLTSLCLEVRDALAPEDEDEDLFETVDMSAALTNPVPPAISAPPTEEKEEPSSPSGNEAASETDMPDAASDPSDIQEEPEPDLPVEYGYNMLDIDFTALSETVSGDLKALDQYVAGLSPSRQNEYTGLFKGKNLILITAEAFTAEVIDPERTPTLYRLSTQGIQFTDFYQPSSAGTTGGEYSILMGMYPTNGGSSMKDTADHLNYMTIGSMLDRMGYYGKAYHNNSYTYYDRHQTHNNLGYSDGFTGKGNGMEEYLTKQWPESDLEMMQATLPQYLDKQPFNIYYMTVSGHSRYGREYNAMSKLHWEDVSRMEGSETVKGYYACQMELENALTYLVETLEEQGIANDTVICLCADHFPYGLDAETETGTYEYLSELYGMEIHNNWERDHNRLILWCGSLEENDPIVVSTPTSSIDILPTLLNLFGCEYDSRLLPGRDVFSDALPLVFTLAHEWKTDLGTFVRGRFIPADDSVVLPEDYEKNVKAIVRNKVTYCKRVLAKDYFRHVFTEEVDQ